ncbi:MAG: hypothetical protein HC908_16745 [Calothrix sp. SM1_7_51]|nr:hypothetical protein [Calothrix sp. SM1_7_51]
MLNQTLKTKVLATLTALTATFFFAPTPVRADNSQYVNEVGAQLVRAAIRTGLRGYT